MNLEHFKVWLRNLKTEREQAEIDRRNKNKAEILAKAAQSLKQVSYRKPE